MIYDGITINGLHSFRDFGLFIKHREIGQPSKKSIRDTVPYMNGYYDFSAINGKPCWGERKLTYVFDIVEDSVEQMDAERIRILNWLANVHETEIQDDTIPGYHFIGSYDADKAPEDGESCELTVEFVCQPFKISNYEASVTLVNGSNTFYYGGQAINAHISATEAGTVTLGGYTQSIMANVKTELGAMLENGVNVIEVNCSGTITMFYTEAMI